MQALTDSVCTPASRWVVLGTGGTIAGRAAQAGDNVGYVAAQVSVADLVSALPGLQALPLELEQVSQVDSKDMDFAVWQVLVARVAHHLKRPEVAGLVITHGTDTLEETAFFLHSVLQPGKPVVLTCAMRPATALVPDGPQNLMDALAVVRHPGAQGVLVVCAGQIHGAEDVAKVHTYRMDAFDSGDAGALGCVEEGLVRMFRPWPQAHATGLLDADTCQRIQACAALPRVALVTSHADTDAWMVQALLALPDPVRPLRGIVVAATGNATVHRALQAALVQAQAQGIEVVLCSRCARGRVLVAPGQHPTGLSSRSAVKTRIALALDLLLR